jgi:hypothetical protein
MIVANEHGRSERNIDSAVGGTLFDLIIIDPDEIGKLPPGKWPRLHKRWMARLHNGGRLIIAKGIEGYGDVPKGVKHHSWSVMP